MTTNIVIIGGSFGGLTAAYRLRRHLKPDQARITLIAKDPRFVFIAVKKVLTQQVRMVFTEVFLTLR